MIKKITLSLMAIAAVICLSSCGATQSLTGQGAGQTAGQSQAGQSQGLLGNLISGLVSQAVPLSQKAIEGTWTYSSPSCKFTSESYLAQAGGAVAATAVEDKLGQAYAALGIVPGNCTFTFAADGSCAIAMGQYQIAGTYTLNPDTRELTITSQTGLINLNAKVYYSIGQLTLLFDASKLLSLAKTVATFTGKGSSTVATVGSLLNSYEGMQVGMNLTK